MDRKIFKRMLNFLLIFDSHICTFSHQVSHNTGLARDIHDQGVYVEDGTKPLAELNIGDGHQRYYFPSSRDIGGGSAIVSDSIKEESNEPETQAAGDTANGDDHSSQVKLASSNRRMSSVLKPLQLSVAPRTPTTPISEILTPVSEPAFLLASLCSTMEKLPVSLATPRDPHQDSALLQTYLRERAVQDARVKQSQYHPRLFKEGMDALTPVGTPGTPTSSGTPTLSYSNAMTLVDSVRSSLCTTTFTSVSQLISSHTNASYQESVIPRPPPLVWALQKSAKASDSDLKQPISSNTIETLDQSTTSSNAGGVSSLLYLQTLPSSPVPVKQETVLSPVKSLSTSTTMHSIPLVKLTNPMSSRSRTNSEADAGADSQHHALQGVDMSSTQDIKPEDLVQSQPSDDKINATQSVIAIVSSSASDTVLSSAKPTDEVALPTSTTGSLLSSNSVIVSTSGSSSPPLPSSNLIKKPKAEFMPPSSGPAPSYVR